MQIIEANHFKIWLKSLRDTKAKAIISSRIMRLRDGLGDVKSVGDNIFELRVHYAQGFRVYWKRHGEEIIILLCGGDKDSQTRDIVKAKEIAEEYKE